MAQAVAAVTATVSGSYERFRAVLRGLLCSSMLSGPAVYEHRSDLNDLAEGSPSKTIDLQEGCYAILVVMSMGAMKPASTDRP